MLKIFVVQTSRNTLFSLEYVTSLVISQYITLVDALKQE
jgi:hypothetical protein